MNFIPAFLNQIQTSPSQPNPCDCLLSLLPPSHDWTSILQITQTVPRTRCGRPVKKGDICFKCLDCSPDKYDHIFCDRCFIKSEHSNHRIRYRNDTFGYCDCGDENYILKKAFCQDHQEKNLDLKELKGKIPKAFRKNLKVFLTKIFLEAIDIIEGADLKKWKENLQEYKNVQKLLLFFCDFISWIIEDNICFLMFFGNYLKKKLRNPKNLLHNCSNYDELSFYKEKTPCECTLIELIFRFNFYFAEEIKEKILALIFKLSPSIAFTNSVLSNLKLYINFMISSDLIKHNFYFSTFLKLYLFLNSKHQVVSAFFKENNEIILIKLQKLCNGLTEFNSYAYKNALDNLFNYYISRIVRFKESIFEIGLSSDILKKIIEKFILIKNLNPNQINAKINVLQLLLQFLGFLRGMLKRIQKESDEIKKKTFGLKIFNDIFKELYLCAEKEVHEMKDIVKNEKYIDFVYGCQNVSNKIFASFLAFFLNCFDYDFEATGKFLEEIENGEKFLEKIFEEVLLALYVDFMIQNKKTEKSLQIKKVDSNIYSISETFFKAFDLFTMKFFFQLKTKYFSFQKILTLINSTLNLTKLNELSVGKDFFDLKFLLELTFFLIFDDLSTFNIINMLHSKKFHKDSETLFMKNKLNFILINLSYINPQFKFEPLKKIVNIKEYELESNLSEISDYNEKNKSFELKKEFRDKFEIFSFAENSTFYFELFERLKLLCNQEKTINVITGNIPDIIIKEKSISFFKPLKSFAIFDIIIELILINEEIEEKLELNGCLTFVLKLFDTLLKMSNFFNDFSIFLPRKQEILIKIKKMISKYPDYELILLKIQEKIILINIEEIKKEKDFCLNNTWENFKQKNNERKQKIMEDFNSKQKIFRLKNKETHSIDIEKEFEPKKEELSCNVCLQNLTKDLDVLVYICYISKDNIHSLLDSNTKNISYYMTSCGHLFHKNCHLNNRKFQKIEFLQYIDYNSEFFCSYCKSLSNVLVPIVEDIIDFIPSITNFFDMQIDFTLAPKNFDFLIEYIKSNKENNENNIKFKINDKKSVFFEDFFEEVMIATCFEEESKEELCIAKFLDEVLINSFETSYLKNLTTYLLNSIRLTKNLFVLFSYYVSKNEIKTKYYEKYKAKLLFDLLNLSKIMNLSEFFQSYNQNLHLIFIKTLLRIRMLFSNIVKEDLFLLQTVIKLFLNQLFIITVIALSEDLFINYEKIQSFLIDSDLKSKVMGFLSPYYFLVLGMILTFFKLDNKFNEILDEYLNNDHDIENSRLFKVFENLLAPDPFFLKFLCEKINFKSSPAQIPMDLILSFKQKFFSTIVYDIPWLHTVTTFEDFTKCFMSRKCEICEFYPKIPKNDLYMCVFCCKIMCNGICKVERSEGNLTAHNKENHAGNCIFINLLKGDILLVNMPRLVAMGTIFTSKFGKEYNQYMFDLNNFYMDKNLICKLVNSYFDRKFPQNLFYQAMNDENRYVKVPNWKNL